jgi:hypothetical protein
MVYEIQLGQDGVAGGDKKQGQFEMPPLSVIPSCGEQAQLFLLPFHFPSAPISTSCRELVTMILVSTLS